jgi:hypothetical protein
MKVILNAIVASTAAVMLFWTLPVSAQTQKPESEATPQGNQGPAVPSSQPAVEARPPIVEQRKEPAAEQTSRTQPAAPSSTPASQATPPAVEAQSGKSGEGEAKQ